MPRTSFSRSPKIQKGALVQLLDTLGVPVPIIVPFQYNPEKVTRSFTTWDPAEAGAAQRQTDAPVSQPFDPEEHIDMVIELDASEDLEDDQPQARLFGVAPRIAALETMLFAFESPAATVARLAGRLAAVFAPPAERPSVPVTLLVWGIGRIVPVRVNRYSIEEQVFLPSLRPLQATVNLGMKVLQPEAFKGMDKLSVNMAKGAYALYRKQQQALTALSAAQAGGEAIRALLPF